MFDNLPELMKNYPLGSKIQLTKEEKDKYAEGKFIVEGYIYEKRDHWYPAHKLWDGKWEVYIK